MFEEFYYFNRKKVILKRSTIFKAFITSPNEGIEDEDLGMMNEYVKKDRDNGITLVELTEELDIASAGTGSDAMTGDELFVFEDEAQGEAILTYEFMVKFKDNAYKEKINVVILDDRFKFEKRPYGINIYLGKIKNKDDYLNILIIIDEIRKKDFVEYAHPNFKSFTNLLQFPTSNRFSEQWALNSNGVGINVKDVWNDLGFKGQGIKIAIIDVGVDVDHEDLIKNGQNVSGFDTINDLNRFANDPSPLNGDSHGTCCAGIAAANGSNLEGICGVAPESEIIAIRVARETRRGWVTDANELAHGIYKAIELKANVISNSWYYFPRTDIIVSALAAAKARGCVIVCASGNYIKGNVNDNLNVTFPANLSGIVISVGACNKLGRWVGEQPRDIESWSSKYKPAVNICAPGIDILTTNYYDGDGARQNKYREFSGTSAATPIVAGVIALMLNANSSLTPDEVEQILFDTADPLNSNPPGKTGHGKVNALKAVNRALGN